MRRPPPLAGMACPAGAIDLSHHTPATHVPGAGNPDTITVDEMGEALVEIGIEEKDQGLLKTLFSLMDKGELGLGFSLMDKGELPCTSMLSRARALSLPRARNHPFS